MCILRATSFLRGDLLLGCILSQICEIFATDNPIISDYLYILKKFLPLVSLGFSEI